jgi:site-specific DNA recombinase
LKKVTKIAENKGSKVALKKIRVAAYCRVSTDSDAQLESLEAQKIHYENYITSRDDWEFAGLYFDEGITGTKKDKRPELMHLVDDCKAGKIDFVITKSISRFSRNTTDCLELVRKLLTLHIPIFFEKEYIETALYLILTPNTGLFFVYCSIYCGFVGISEPVHCGLSLICRLNLQVDTER